MLGKTYILVLAAIVSILLRAQGLHTFSLSLLFALLYFLFKSRSNYHLLTLCIVIFAFFQLNPHYFQSPPPMPTGETVVGNIASIPKYDGNKISFEFNTLEKNKVIINFYAKTKEEKLELEKNLIYGMKCSINGKYELPNEPSNEYSFDYKEYLKSKNIYFLFTPKSFSSKSCIETNHSLFSLQRYRQLLMNYIKEYFPKESKGIVMALILGDRGEIDQEILHSYQSLGIIHLLAVSGLHVGLFTTILYFLLIRIGITKERTIDLLLLLLPVYAILAGAAPSVLRATAMSIVVLISMRGRRKINSLDAISFVCIGMLVINPSFIFHLGFQLSFLVSYSLIISTHVLLHKYTSWIAQLLTVTIVAQMISFPIIIYHFYEISLLSIPLNLIYIPFVTFFTLPLSFITLISHFLFAPIGQVLLDIFNYVISNVHETLLQIMKLPFATLTLGRPPQYLLLFYYMAIGMALYKWEKATTIKSIFKNWIPIFIVIFIHWNLPYFKNEGEVTMIDVGQGDSIYIELPRRKGVYLIDTGGAPEFEREQQWQVRNKTFDVGKDVLLPFLKAKGIRKINKLILTHSHIDHIGGAKALINKIQVESLLYSAHPSGEFERELLEEFKNCGTNIIYVKNGDYWRVGNNQFLVISSNLHDENINERSIVLYAKIGGLKWLFTGDLEEEGERNLMNNYPNINLDVLKVGHHGSHTSTTEKLLDATTPIYALISVGENNRYSHPDSEVINRLNKRNIHIYRTDLHGAITYQFKGNKGFFATKKN